MRASRLVFGLHAVATLLERHPEQALEVFHDARRADARLNEVLGRAGQAGVAVHAVDRAKLEAMVGRVNHQGIVARVRESEPGGERELYALLESLDEVPLLLVLDGVQDPHNLGACLRTADAAGVHAVVTPKDRACGLTPTVRKVASGAAESVPFFQVTNLVRVLRELQTRGLWLVGMAGEGASELFEVELKGPLGLVLGAEEKGLRRLTREACDVLARLPMSGTVASLNVSVAAGIALYEARRQRGSPP
jgi:23S rRNA (guanosine2251-2'-O)-methyltransferase